MQILSEGYKFRRGTGTPFEALGRDWCRFCSMDVDAVTKHYNQGQVYGYKRWCRRCKQPLAGAAMFHAPIISAIPNSLFSLAAEWMNEKAKDHE